MEGLRRRLRSVFRPHSSGSFSRRYSSLRRGADALPKPPPGKESYTVNEVDGGSRDVVKVRDIEPCLSQNGVSHKTDQFELMYRSSKPQLVVRRGQPFTLDVKLSRAFSPDTDALSFIFTLAGVDKPNYGQGTLVGVPLLTKKEFSLAKQDPESWSAVVVRNVENIISVEITAGANSIIGQWKMEVDTKLKNGQAVSYAHKYSFYLLFNPWSKNDSTWLEREDERREYVVADTGLIWRGSYNVMRPCVWNYAQYDKDILECAFYLVHKIGKVPFTSCNDPVKISRALSAAVNSPDDNGCLKGNWSTEFDGGTPPTKWVGSMKILQKYFSNKKPVKYGQCWVFAGVLTTICRALGIPCRPVTTYSSAHDTQNSLTVDYFVDDSGEIMEELNSDSVWNYHVWNEVWMKRPDLGSAFDGWQVIDATPQELSDDMFRCGPAPVAAVKEGEVLRPYDASFVYAEVNADKVFWRYTGPTQPLKLLNKDMHGVGHKISTKAVGSWSRDDITLNYKYPEKSTEERVSMLKALKMSESLFSRYYLNEEFNDIKFDFKLRDDIVIGSPFSVVVLIDNRSEEKDFTVVINLRVDAVLYTGKLQDPVKKSKSETIVKRNTVQKVEMNVSYSEYVTKLVDQCAFNIACMATVKDTNYEYFAQDDFRVRKPDIKIKVEGDAEVGQPLTCTAGFINPLPIRLKKGEFLIEGPGLDSQLKMKIKESIGPNEEAKVEFKLTPRTPGRKTIAAKFVSKELDDVDGFLNMMVGDNKGGSDGNGTTNSNIRVV